MSVSVVGAAPALAYSSMSSARGASSASSTAAPGGSAALSAADERTVVELKQRDRVVRAHELAHMTAGAGLVTRGASYTYQTGPDGQRYAVGGEVGIDVSPGRTPAETLSRAERIRAAALAPADPSAQDRQVAASADRMAIEARLEISAGEVSSVGSANETSAASGASGPAASYSAIASANAGGGSRVDTYA